MNKIRFTFTQEGEQLIQEKNHYHKFLQFYQSGHTGTKTNKRDYFFVLITLILIKWFNNTGNKILI